MAVVRLRGALYKSFRRVVQWVNDAAAIVNELQTDHGTFKTSVDAIEVALEELMDDHATQKTSHDAMETLIEELHDDHATFKAAVDGNETLIEEMYDDEEAKRNALDFVLADGVLSGSWGIATAAAVTLAGTGWIKYRIGGQTYFREMPATITLTDSGDIIQNKFGAWRIVIDRTGAITTQDTGAQMAWNSAEIALLNLSAVAPTANTCTIGYFTVTDSGAGGFNIGTTNTAGGTATGVVYHVRGPVKQAAGLTAALGAATAVGSTPTRYSTGTKDVMVNGRRIAQIAAEADKAFNDADTIAQSKFGSWLICTNLAQNATVSVAADGKAGAVSAMAYNTAILAKADVATVVDRLPPMFVPVCRLTVTNNLAGTWTANTNDINGTAGTAAFEDATVGTWARASTTGWDSFKITPASIPAVLTAPKPASAPATLSAAKPASGPATLTAPKPASAPAALTASTALDTFTDAAGAP